MVGVDEEFDDNLPLIIYASRDKIRLYFVDCSIFFYFVDPMCSQNYLEWKSRGVRT